MIIRDKAEERRTAHWQELNVHRQPPRTGVWVADCHDWIAKGLWRRYRDLPSPLPGDGEKEQQNGKA